jgi:Na+/proline symporter
MKPFSAIAAVIFSILSLAHLLRLYFRWEVIVNGFVLPQWISVPACILPAALAIMLWREARGPQQ